MKNFDYLIKNFFTHKAYLAPAHEIPGTMFTPLHFIFSAIVLAIVIVGAILVCKKSLCKQAFIIVWAFFTVTEVIKIIWETVSGPQISFEITGNLPIYACSIFIYAMPFAIWGRGVCKKAACFYVCTLGMLGASVNFFYPMTVLYSYSCISFAGFQTFGFHGAMLFTCIAMLISGYSRYSDAESWWEPFLASVPGLIMSIPANIVNYTVGSDYMFFRGDSAFLPAIFGNVPDPIVTVIIYLLYIFVPAAFYFPAYIVKARRKANEEKAQESIA